MAAANTTTLDSQTLTSATSAAAAQMASGVSATAGIQSSQASQDAKTAISLQLSNYELTEQQRRATDLLAQVNESWNSNRYIVNAVAREKQRVEQLDAQAKRDIYLSRQTQQSADYKTHLFACMVRVLIVTLIGTLLTLVPVAMWRAGALSGKALIFFVVLILAIYMVVTVIIVRNAGVRRQGQWDKYYFSAKNLQSANSCSSSSSPNPTTNTANTANTNASK
jgi:heme/copper-type cytochrome/quinol oxidase subunit 4